MSAYILRHGLAFRHPLDFIAHRVRLLSKSVKIIATQEFD
jgi:hypothetical protein